MTLRSCRQSEEGEGGLSTRTSVSRFRSSPNLVTSVPSQLRNHKGHWNHRLASVIQIEKFAPSKPQMPANFSIITLVDGVLDRNAPTIHLVVDIHDRWAAVVPGEAGVGRTAGHDFTGH